MRKSVLSVIFFLSCSKSFFTSKKISLIVLLFFFLIHPVFSQPHWTNTNAIPNGRYDDTYFINMNTGYVVWGGGMMYKTTDGGNSWVNNYNYETVRFRSIGFFDENNGVMGTLTDTASFFRTTNAGANWTKVTNFQGSGPAPKGICGINIFSSDIGYAVGIYDSPPYFLKTTNKGANWISIPVDTSLARGLVDVYFWSQDSGIVVGNWSRNNSLSTSNSVVLYTTNGGNSFTRVFKSARNFAWCWKITAPSKNTFYASVENPGNSSVLKTTNKGINWTETIFPFALDMQGIGFATENTGWVGGNNGYTYKTTDGGISWMSDPWGFYVNRFRIYSDTSGYACGDIVYKFTTLVGIQNISAEIPEKFSLQQNYPNPFNPSTTIRWTVPNSGFVSVKVYNSLGNEIETLVNEKQNAGSYSIDFNAASLPSGIYFYKLETEGFSETKKMILVK